MSPFRLPGDLTNSNLYLFVRDNPWNRKDPSGHDFLDVLVAVGVSGILSGVVNGVTSVALHGSFADGFSRGFISGTVTSFLLFSMQGFPPNVAFALGNGIGDIVTDMVEGNYRNPDDAAFAVLKTGIDVFAGAAFGAWFGGKFPGVATADAASFLQALLAKPGGNVLWATCQELGKILSGTSITGGFPAVINRVVDLVHDMKDESAKLFDAHAQDIRSNE